LKKYEMQSSTDLEDNHPRTDQRYLCIVEECNHVSRIMWHQLPPWWSTCTPRHYNQYYSTAELWCEANKRNDCCKEPYFLLITSTINQSIYIAQWHKKLKVSNALERHINIMQTRFLDNVW